MLAFLGGTGPEGRGLALRYALAGHEVVIGSRDPDKAKEAALKLQEKAPPGSVRGEGNQEAARQGDIVFLTVPYDALQSLLPQLVDELAGKIVVNVVAPLVFRKGRASAVQVPEGSAAVQSQILLPRSQVVAAFQNLSATKLLAVSRPMDGDVVVCSDHEGAKERIVDLVGLIRNLRGLDGGGLENARYVEQLTALLLSVNRIYKAHSSIKLVGL